MKPITSSLGINRWALVSSLAKKNNWTVISMKNDWKRIFSFE